MFYCLQGLTLGSWVIAVNLAKVENNSNLHLHPKMLSDIQQLKGSEQPC